MFLWRTRKYADMKIVCDGKYWLVHRNILASRCAWFNDRIWKLRKKEGYYELVLEDHHHLLVRAFLYFIYNGVIDHEHLRDRMKPDNVVLAKLHRMGIDFDLPELRDALVTMLTKALNGRIEYIAENPTEKIKVTGILGGVKFAYSRAEHQQAELRAAYLNFFSRCLKQIGPNSHFYEKIRSIPAFSADLFQVMGRKNWGDESDEDEDGESESDTKARRQSRKKSGKEYGKKHDKKTASMAEFTIEDADLTRLRGKVIIVTGTCTPRLAHRRFIRNRASNSRAPPRPRRRRGQRRPVPPPAPQVIYPSAGSDAAAFFTGPSKSTAASTTSSPMRRASRSAATMLTTMALGAGGELQEPCHTVLDVHLKGTINTTTLAIQYMRTQDPQGGSIVLNSSTTGLHGAGGVDHVISKYGILGFARGVESNLDTAALSIRVNVLMPGPADSQVVEVIAADAARDVAQLMADSTKDGHVVYAGEGRCSKIEEAVLLPAHR
ncbi:hypothetical protein PG997_014820 [Apiospora hydei]|uniref:BTB domain-containing protein n=1 Tax=Apiospora hydei TaxID=1337664 RepID=A0ABR1UUX1_9PEZI